jgi:hypothetical protein
MNAVVFLLAPYKIDEYFGVRTSPYYCEQFRE